MGPAGPQGPDGAQGPQGPTGIVSTSFTAATGSNPATVLAFIGPTLGVTVAAGQKVYVAANKGLGSTAVGGASSLNLYVCYQSTVAGSMIQAVGGGIFGLQVPQNTRFSFGINGDFTPGAGTFNVGMCGSSVNSANWNHNEYGYVTAIVHN
jgi:hypothetical protein